MPTYTRAWTDNTPLDSDQAATLGQAIRNLRTDIDERMTTLTAGNWTSSDPVGGPVSNILYLPHDYGCDASATAAVGWFAGAGPPWTDGYLVAAGGGAACYRHIPIVLPTGVTITKVRVAMYIITGKSTASMAFQNVYRQNLIGTMIPVAMGSGTIGTADSTWHWFDAGISSYTTVAGDVIWAVITSTAAAYGDGRYGGAEITYTRPNLTNTI